MEKEWRKVGDALPDHYKSVLVIFYPRHPIMEGTTFGIDHRREWAHLANNSPIKRILSENNGFSLGKVTHWMPLPEKPTNQ